MPAVLEHVICCARRSSFAGENTLTAVATAALMLCAPTTAHPAPSAQTCSLASTASTPGAVWQGRERLGLREIAGLLAPVLWFSADEPLLGDGNPPIPTAHPCDKPADRAVVYYQVTRLTYRGDTPAIRPEEDETGIKIRARLPTRMRPFVLGYTFGGLRFGVQALGFRPVEQLRFVWQIGAGAW